MNEISLNEYNDILHCIYHEDSAWSPEMLMRRGRIVKVN